MPACMPGMPTAASCRAFQIRGDGVEAGPPQGGSDAGQRQSQRHDQSRAARGPRFLYLLLYLVNLFLIHPAFLLTLEEINPFDEASYINSGRMLLVVRLVPEREEEVRDRILASRIPRNATLHYYGRDADSRRHTAERL